MVFRIKILNKCVIDHMKMLKEFIERAGIQRFACSIWSGGGSLFNLSTLTRYFPSKTNSPNQVRVVPCLPFGVTRRLIRISPIVDPIRYCTARVLAAPEELANDPK